MVLRREEVRPVRVIYLDELCLLNFLIDLLLLYATARLGGHRARPGRLCLAAGVGAAYAAASLLPGWGWLPATAVKLAAAALMCLLAFGGEGRLLRCTVLFLALSFSFGGMVWGLSLWQGGGAPYADLRLLLSAGAICLGAFLLLFGRLARHGGSARDLLPVRLSLDGRSVTVTALLDTGNSLTDPLSGAPVLVADCEVLLPLLPPILRRGLRREDLACPAALLEPWTAAGVRPRLIPYRTVGQSGGLLLALRPDTAAVGRRPVTLVAAFSPTPLSDSGVYRAVLGEADLHLNRRRPL